MSLKSSARRLALVAVPVVLAAALAACSSGGSSGGSTSTATADSATLAKVQADVQALMKPPTDIGVTEPLKALPTGKTLLFMECDTPICVATTPVYAQAAQALGMKFSSIHVGSAPNEVASAFDQAVAARPDALISGAIAPELFQSQLQQLVSNGTKVVLYATTDPGISGLTALVFPESVFTTLGGNMANLIYADSNGAPGEVLYVNTPELPALLATTQGFKDRMGELCSGCTVSTLDINLNEIGTGVGPKVVSYLQSHPNVKYVVTQFGDLEVGVPQAVQASGIKDVKLISANGSNVNFQYVADGTSYADIVNFLDVTFWQTADIVARALAGQSFTVPPVPTQILTKQNLTFDPSQPAPFGSDYVAEFKKLWGVS